MGRRNMQFGDFTLPSKEQYLMKLLMPIYSFSFPSLQQILAESFIFYIFSSPTSSLRRTALLIVFQAYTNGNMIVVLLYIRVQDEEGWYQFW